jgi:hypothetical protein
MGLFFPATVSTFLLKLSLPLDRAILDQHPKGHDEFAQDTFGNTPGDRLAHLNC